MQVKRDYTPAEDATIREHYPHMTTLQLAYKMGRPEMGVSLRARKLGVKKSLEHMTKVSRAKQKQAEAAKVARRKEWLADRESQRASQIETDDVYQGIELKPYDGRPGAMAAFDLPSLWGQQLRYRDGRVEVLPE